MIISRVFTMFITTLFDLFAWGGTVLNTGQDFSIRVVCGRLNSPEHVQDFLILFQSCLILLRLEILLNLILLDY